MGKMVFTILGSVAELERSMIVERVKAGMRNARAKGIRLGRPRKVVDARRIVEFRAAGIDWQEISRRMDLGVGTAYRAYREHSKKPLSDVSRMPDSTADAAD
jgi:DNA invertase Pin-like site-specific DNA recombinase